MTGECWEGAEAYRLVPECQTHASEPHTTIGARLAGRSNANNADIALFAFLFPGACMLHTFPSGTAAEGKPLMIQASEFDLKTFPRR